MSSHCFVHFPPSSSSSKFNKFPKPSKFRSISSQIQTPESENDEKNQKNLNFNNLNFLKFTVTLTVISASLPQPATAAGKKRAPRKASIKKEVEALSIEEVKSWIEGLPIVSERIPYTEIAELKNLGMLKHIVKPSAVELRERAVAVLVVLEDSRALRTVLPNVESDRKFWGLWDELKIDNLCVNAYSPPVKAPEMPLSVLARISLSLPFHKPFVEFFNRFQPKKKSKKELELREARMQLQRQKKEEVVKKMKEREMIERNERIKKREADNEKRMRRRKEYQEKMVQVKANALSKTAFWTSMAKDQMAINTIGVLFFVIFYRTVVLNYKKQKKDYEDRVKIQQADAEERRKMKEMEAEMGWSEAGGGEDESELVKEGEENPYLKMTKEFMKSGARVRRAQNRRLPQYLERGVDVKFTDVAGLGKIRLELEEIVKFFTHGEMYRRRGVKIPGLTSFTLTLN